MREEDERGEGGGERCTKGWKAHRESEGGETGSQQRTCRCSPSLLPSPIHLFCHTAEGGRDGGTGAGVGGAWDSSFLPVSISCRLRSNLPPSSYWAYSFGRHEWKGRERGFGPALQSRKINIKKVFFKKSRMFLSLCLCFFLFRIVPGDGASAGSWADAKVFECEHQAVDKVVDQVWPLKKRIGISTQFSLHWEKSLKLC